MSKKLFTFITMLLVMMIAMLLLPAGVFAQAGGSEPQFQIKANGHIDSLYRGWTNMGKIVFTNGESIAPSDVAGMKSGTGLTGNIALARITNALSGFWSGTVTNAGVGASSNVLWYYRGVVTNVTYLP
jgi:hypothetical protein